VATIRQTLARRAGLYRTGVIGFLLASGILIGLVPRVFAIRFICAVLIGAVVLAALVSVWFLSCPNCNKSLKTASFNLYGTKQCPYCGHDFDQPMPEGESHTKP
jgi:hypothetical protein